MTNTEKLFTAKDAKGDKVLRHLFSFAFFATFAVEALLAQSFTPGGEYSGTASGTPWNPGAATTGNPSFYQARDITVYGDVKTNYIGVFLDNTGRRMKGLPVTNAVFTISYVASNSLTATTVTGPQSNLLATAVQPPQATNIAGVVAGATNTAHVAAVDPHGDRAYADAAVAVETNRAKLAESALTASVALCLTGAVYSASSGQPVLTNRTLYIPTNSFSGGSGGSGTSTQDVQVIAGAMDVTARVAWATSAGTAATATNSQSMPWSGLTGPQPKLAAATNADTVTTLTGTQIAAAGGLTNPAAFDAAGTASVVQANLTVHTNRTDNPHATTAAQVGAVSTNDTRYLGALTNNQAGVTISGNLTASNRFELYGMAATSYVAQATGGAITYAGGREIHTFLTNENFVLTSTTACQVLMVAGGGGGGSDAATGESGSGGGAGGLILTNLSVSGTNAIVIGAGGGGGTNRTTNGGRGSPGGNTTAFSLTAIGGGNGCGYGGVPGNGGSGGGAAQQASNASGGTGTVSQGYNGGATTLAGTASGAGGGGAGGLGGNGGVGAYGGAGGDGLVTTILGTNATFATGGTGGAWVSPAVGTNGANGAANTGNGGGGALEGASGTPMGGNGGSGIVIVSIPAVANGWTQDIMHVTYDAGAFQFDRNVEAPNIPAGLETAAPTAQAFTSNQVQQLRRETKAVHDGYVSTALGSSGANNVTIGRPYTIFYSDATHWIGYPGLARLWDGTLFACFSIGMSDFDVSSAEYYSFSVDDGTTWATPTLLYKNPSPSIGSGSECVGTFNDGSFELIGRDPGNSSNITWVITGWRTNGTFSFSPAVPLTVQPPDAANVWVNSGRTFELSSGTRLRWLYEENLNSYTGASLFVSRSIDRGVTYSTPQRLTDYTLGCGENDTVQYPNGTVFCMVRSQPITGGNNYLSVQSTDDGITWSVARTNIAGVTSIGHPSLALTRGGALHLLAGGSTDTQLRPQYDWTSYNMGTNWTAARRLSGTSVSEDSYDAQCLLSGNHIGAVGCMYGTPHTSIGFQDFYDGYGIFCGASVAILSNVTVTAAASASSFIGGTFTGSVLRLGNLSLSQTSVNGSNALNIACGGTNYAIAFGP